MTHLFERKSLPFATVKGVDEKTGEFEATATREIVDRDEEIVRVKAFQKRIDSFKKNPVLMFNHMTALPPIGEVLDLTFKAEEMDFRGRFRNPDDIQHELLRDAVVAGRTGFLKSFSIGFLVYDVAPGGTDADGQKARRQITDAELTEISLCGIPANVDATMKSVKQLRLIDAEHLPADLFPVREIVKTLYSAPTDRDFLARAKDIILRIEAERRKGVAATDEMAKAFEALCEAAWSIGSERKDGGSTPMCPSCDNAMGYCTKCGSSMTKPDGSPKAVDDDEEIRKALDELIATAKN